MSSMAWWTYLSNHHTMSASKGVWLLTAATFTELLLLRQQAYSTTAICWSKERSAISPKFGWSSCTFYSLRSLRFHKNTRAAANSKRDCCYWVLLSPWVILQHHSPNWSKINKQIKECYPPTSLRLCILLSQLACCCNNFRRLLQISLTAANTNQNQTLKNLLFCKFGSAKISHCSLQKSQSLILCCLNHSKILRALTNFTLPKLETQ